MFTVDDVPFVNNMAIDDATGNVVTLSRMTLPQLRAELEVKGLSPSGNRRDLSRKVQVDPSAVIPTLTKGHKLVCAS